MVDLYIYNIIYVYVDNATLIKSGVSTSTGGNLTLNIDYGFPNKITILAPSTNKLK